MASEELFFVDATNYNLFKVNSDKNFMPFPINQSLPVRVTICSVLAAVLVLGLRKRLLILAYLRSPEVKLNPPNILFCLDQINGIFLAFIIIFRIVFNLLPLPLSDLIDPKVCSFAELMSGLYLSGTIIWGCYTAILKLLYVKVQKWLHESIGLNKLMVTTVVMGISKMAWFSLVMINADKDSYIKRSCYHRNATELEILYGFEPGNTWQKQITMVFTVIGLVMIITELGCYLVLFRHIAQHNNQIMMTGMLDPKIIATRNQVNAITLKGLFATWMLEMIQIFFAGIVSIFIGNRWNREVSAFLRQCEFLTVPLIQIYSSPPIKRFLLSKTASISTQPSDTTVKTKSASN